MEKLKSASIADPLFNIGEISVIDLIENAKKSLKEEDFNSASYHLNLILLSPTLDLSTKIATQLMNCSISAKLKHSDSLIKIARKIFKYLKQNDVKIIPEEIILIFMKILQKVAENCEEEGNALYACWFFYYAKNIYDFRNLKREEANYEAIKTGLTRTLKKLGDEMGVFSKDLEYTKEKLQRITDYFTNNKGVTIQLEKPDETYYLISSTWISNLIVFVKLFLDQDSDKESIFNLNNICLLYFDNGEDEEDEVRREILGSYPGMVNNFHLLGSSENWFDPEELFTNVYLNKDLRENADFLIIPKDLYLYIKEIFRIPKFNEIERKSVVNSENQLTVEVNLAKIKVLFVNDDLREAKKSLLKPKYLQISKFATFSQLENKLLRIFKHLDKKNENEEYELKIYKFDRNSKEIFDLITSYTNKNKTFKIIIKELKKNENSQKTISDLKIGPNETLIVEVISKNTIVKPFIRVGTENLACSLCNNKIESGAIVNCDNCTQSIYCSNKCKSEDTVHSEFHKKVSSLYKKKLTLEEVFSLNISNFFDANSKGGLVGIKNLGNTCFVSTVFQCLSHCDDLTKYFISKSFLDDINKNSKQGPDGKIAKAYYELIRELWIGSSSSISPMDFKVVFSAFIKQFSGNGHQDALEVFFYFLASLHEDLNRATKIKEDFISGNQLLPKDTSGIESIAVQKLRNNSIIMDLFNGFFQTKIRCPGCKTTTTSYDSFTFLPLTIPDKGTSKVRFKIFPDNFEYHYIFVEVFDVNKFTSIKTVKNKIKEVPSLRNAEFDALLLKNKALTSILPDDELIYDYVFTRVDFTEEEFVDIEIIFCQVETSSSSKNKGDYVTFYVSPCNFFDQRYYLLLKYKEYRPIGYPKAFSISKKGRVKDLYIEVYKYYRRIMDDRVVKKEEEGKVDTSYYESFYENVKNREFIEKDFDKYYLGVMNDEGEGENSDRNKLKTNSEVREKEMFDLNFFNNIPPSNSYFFSKPACEYCKSSKCAICKVNLTMETKIYEMYAMQQVIRPFILLADFSRFSNNFYKFYTEFVDTSDPRSYYRGELTLSDCLDTFRKEEKFDKERPYNCEKCNKPQEAFKKVEIFEAPRFLVVQFKRFKLKGHKSLLEMVNNKKNETFVYYPLNNFDISSYVIGPNKEANYELLGMTQHTGGLTGGHYTSLVKNNDKWYEFDDDNVKETSDVNSIINANTYMLYYKKIEKKGSEGENKLLNEETSINSSLDK